MKLRNPVIEIGRRPDARSLADMADRSPRTFIQHMGDLINAGELQLRDIPDLAGLHYALCDKRVDMQIDVNGQGKRAISAAAFPALLGGLTINAWNQMAPVAPSVHRQLVSEIRDTNRDTHLMNVTALDIQKDEVPDGEPFPEIGAKADWVTIGSKRNGRRLSVTTAALREGPAGILDKLNQLHAIAEKHERTLVLNRVTDRYGATGPYVYKPLGVGTALYSATANTPGTRAPLGNIVESNALVNESDLEAARTRLAKMIDDDGTAVETPINECILLVPDALVSTARGIVNSEYVPGVVNEVNSWGPRGAYRPTVLSSPHLDQISTSTWYLGMFPHQFTLKIAEDFTYVTLGQTTESYLVSDIAFQARISWIHEVGARDYTRVVQCTA